MSNISIVASLPKHTIYLIKDTNISYYLSIPKTNNVNISIEIKNNLEKFDFTKNDTLWVKENVLSYYTDIDNIPCSYAIPLFDENYLKIMGSSNTSYYIEAEKIISYLINNIYTLLKNSKINALKQVILIKNDEFLSFISYFKTKYTNRVIDKTLLELLQENNVLVSDYKRLETGTMNYVVGRNTEKLNITIPEEVVKPVEDKTNKIINKEPIPASSGGYISYYLLAFASIVFAVFMLYILF